MSTKKPTTTATKPAAAKPAVAKPAVAKPAAKPVTKPKAPSTNAATAAAAKVPAIAVASSVAAAPTPKETKLEIKSLTLKQLGEVFDDTNELQKKSNKWPLIIDESSRVATFLRHRDVNYINCSDVIARNPEALRRTLIGAIRYNKPFALDIEDRDILWSETKTSFDQVQENVLDDLVCKKLMENENYLKLIRKEIDGDEYREINFAQIGSFKLIVVTSNENLPVDFLNRFTVYKIEA